MSVEPKKMAIIAAAVALLACLLFGPGAYRTWKHRADLSNLQAIAGISGPKAFTLEPSQDLQAAIDAASSDPSTILGPLERALEQKVAEQVLITKGYPDPKAPAAVRSFEASIAYSYRILLLKKWKPGMSQKEVAQAYLAMTQGLKSQYDFKNHTEDILGFK